MRMTTKMYLEALYHVPIIGSSASAKLLQWLAHARLLGGQGPLFRFHTSLLRCVIELLDLTLTSLAHTQA